MYWLNFYLYYIYIAAMLSYKSYKQSEMTILESSAVKGLLQM